MSGLEPWMRGSIESEIDDLVEMMDVLDSMFQQADIAPTEEAYIAFTYGHMMAMAQSLYKLVEDEEMPKEAMDEVGRIISRRRPEILGAFREEFEPDQ